MDTIWAAASAFTHLSSIATLVALTGLTSQRSLSYVLRPARDCRAPPRLPSRSRRRPGTVLGRLRSAGVVSCRRVSALAPVLAVTGQRIESSTIICASGSASVSWGDEYAWLSGCECKSGSSTDARRSRRSGEGSSPLGRRGNHGPHAVRCLCLIGLNSSSRSPGRNSTCGCAHVRSTMPRT